MCNRYELAYEQWRDFCELFGATPDWQIDNPPDWFTKASNQPFPSTVFPMRDGLFLRRADAGAAPLEPVIGRWGIVPASHKGPLKAVRFPCNNARSEGLATTFPFRFLVGKRHGLIPVSRFQEWTGPKGSKTMHNIAAADGRLLLAAALWDQAQTADGPVTSYTMLMQATQPGDDVHPFHDRQPIFLTGADALRWLDPAADHTGLFHSPPAGTLVADPPEPAAA